MPDHSIQLRRAWEAEYGGRPTRLDLPTEWGSGPLPELVRRRFNRPVIDEDREAIFIRFSGCLGVHSIRINGRELDLTVDDDRDLEWNLDNLIPNGNRLEFRIDDRVPRGTSWGQIALVIRAR